MVNDEVSQSQPEDYPIYASMINVLFGRNAVVPVRHNDDLIFGLVNFCTLSLMSLCTLSGHKLHKLHVFRKAFINVCIVTLTVCP
jgi:hypothetical protein